MELLIITINRLKVCSGGTSRIIKNYKLQTEAILSKISNIHKKIKICPQFLSSIKTPVTYYRDCISQIIPLIRLCYKYSIIIKTLYEEVLTYEELFPQESEKKKYCSNQYKNVKSQKDSLKYAKKCNHCLHLKSVLKLGLEEIKVFTNIIRFFIIKTLELKRAISKLVIRTIPNHTTSDDAVNKAVTIAEEKDNVIATVINLIQNFKW